jgi:sec-independent protein translocase protein TatA
MYNIGLPELLLLGIVAVLLFGKRLPEVARSLGQSYQEFRRGLHGLKSEVDEVVYSARSEVRAAHSGYLPLQEPITTNSAEGTGNAEGAHPTEAQALSSE